MARTFTLTSPAFRNGASIPTAYTCDGKNFSPPLRWTAPPKRTRSFALLMDDPDAPSGTFTHWIGWNIPAQARSIPRAAHAPVEGANGAGRPGYTGPCPPSGPAHHYVFRLYALNAKLRLARGAGVAAFKSALRGHVLATAKLTGRYGR